MEFGLFWTKWTVRNRGVRIIEVEFVWNLVSFGPCGLSVIERCPYFRGVRKERFDCISCMHVEVALVTYRKIPIISPPPQKKKKPSDYKLMAC